MAELSVRAVDPRDATSEINDPVYRVYFWKRNQGGYVSREFEVSGASDVLAVCAWAQQNTTESETHVIYAAVVVRDDHKCLIRLVGQDPNAGR